MTVQQTPLFYNTPANEFPTYYPQFDLKNPPFTSKIYSQIPRIAALMRAALASLAATLILIKNTPFVMPVGIGCLAYSVWTLYKNFIKTDPLVEAFYKMVGGQDKYQKLPEFKLIGKESTTHELKKIDWDNLHHPLYRATAQNGNRILIVRALSRYPVQELCSYSQVKTIYAFVEKLEDDDHLFLKIVQAMNLLQSENDTRNFSTNSSSSMGNYKIYVNASIEPELANELAAQT